MPSALIILGLLAAVSVVFFAEVMRGTATATFRTLRPGLGDSIGASPFSVAFVDSQNAFGAKVRTSEAERLTMMEIHGRDHLFEANPPAHSPDGRYRVQMFDELTVDGVALSGRARLQYDGDTIELDGCERPQEAFITSSGVVFIIDWLHADAPAAQGALLVFDRTGRRIQFHRFGANIGSARALRDRGVLVVSTLGAEHADSDSTFTFGLDDGRLISRAATVTEDPTPRTAYDWQRRGFEELADGKTEAARSALLTSVSGEHGTMTPFYVAQTQRALGELADEAGERAAALQHFRAAIAANPKIGVKKRIIALEREVSE